MRIDSLKIKQKRLLSFSPQNHSSPLENKKMATRECPETAGETVSKDKSLSES